MALRNKLILGTVQFGLDYGINNSFGKTSENEAFAILDLAKENGIELLDTADSYGDASNVIGKYHAKHGQTFKILTKFRIDSSSQQSVLYMVDRSLEILKTDRLYCYSYHSYNDFVNYPLIQDELYSLKQRSIIKKIGISVYTNYEFNAAIDSPLFDVIQIPFNILDNHNLRGQLMQKAKKSGKEIHTRSVFLQGLLFMDSNLIPQKLRPLSKYLNIVKDFSFNKNMSIQSMAINYVLCNPMVDNVLIGVENRVHLQKNLDSINEKYAVIINDFVSAINVTEVDLLNPVNWNK